MAFLASVGTWAILDEVPWFQTVEAKPVGPKDVDHLVSWFGSEFWAGEQRVFFHFANNAAFAHGCCECSGTGRGVYMLPLEGVVILVRPPLRWSQGFRCLSSQVDEFKQVVVVRDISGLLVMPLPLEQGRLVQLELEQ